VGCIFFPFAVGFFSAQGTAWTKKAGVKGNPEAWRGPPLDDRRVRAKKRKMGRNRRKENQGKPTHARTW
jgi:hypothetical protein